MLLFDVMLFDGRLDGFGWFCGCVFFVCFGFGFFVYFGFFVGWFSGRIYVYIFVIVLDCVFDWLGVNMSKFVGIL